MPHVSLQQKHPLGSAAWLGSARLPWLLRLIRLRNSKFNPISTVLTLPDLFSASIKVIEAVLMSYFTNVNWNYYYL